MADVSFARENWPILAFSVTAVASLATWWSTMLWSVSSNVAKAVSKIDENEDKHVAHELKFDKLVETEHEHDKRIYALEVNAAHASTGQHPAIQHPAMP